MRQDNEFFASLVPHSFNPAYRLAMRGIFDKTIKYMDGKYSSMSATQCVHQEALDVEEGFDGVICRKHLKILELEDQVKNKSEYIFQLKQHIGLLEDRIDTQGKNLSHYTSLQIELERKLKKAEDRLEELMYQFKRYTKSSSEDVKTEIKNRYFPMSIL